MQIAKGTVVSIDYTLKDDDGNVLDQSQPNQPLTYLQGHQNIIPGLESELEGKNTGDSLDVRVEPSQAYGDLNPSLEQKVPRDRFQGVEDLQVGMRFQAQSDQGPVSVQVTAIEGDEVTVDGNHPLAGKHLNFSVTVQDIREAKPEELEHGHPHHDGGCCGGGEGGGEGGGDGGCCGG